MNSASPSKSQNAPRPFDVVPARVARVQDEPALAFRDEPVLGLLERRLGNHAAHPATAPVASRPCPISPQTLDALAAESAFSGVVRVDRGDEVVLATAYGFADRRWKIPNTPDTRFAMASGVKGMTALAVMSLVEDGTLDLTTTARSVLGDDLPLIDDAVTVEQLLAHRSGIGDYFDEDLPGEITDYLLPVPVHTLAETEDYLAVLDGFPTKFPPDERFSYCNGGFVVLALVAERASGMPFRELVAERVCEPAGMTDTAFLRSDELPEGAAVGYLDADGLRTNVLHLPVRGTGDGGAYTTAADMRRLWVAFSRGPHRVGEPGCGR